ncbi:DUF1707 SHOCT-like domain-containing protein [Enemella sp. A6]|uniref:DUF1707 SHOCT-like domain-containing protein n=1 Tax=Enemella sp. A6 TaxID=3440152 RepID=UPI003EB856FC
MDSTHDDGLRVSNLQRENAAAQLRDAAGDGRIGFDELTPRLDRAFGAVTRADLIDVLKDLVEADKLHEVITDERVAGDGPGYRWDTPLVLDTKESLTKIGEWEVPPFLEVVTGWSTVRLNFMQARPATKLIDLVLISGGGTMILVVPEGWGVDTERLQVSGASSEAKSRVSTRPTGDNPRLIVRGRCAGRLTVRHPQGFDRWQLRRHEKKLGHSDRAAIES